MASDHAPLKQAISSATRDALTEGFTACCGKTFRNGFHKDCCQAATRFAAVTCLNCDDFVSPQGDCEECGLLVCSNCNATSGRPGHWVCPPCGLTASKGAWMRGYICLGCTVHNWSYILKYKLHTEESSSGISSTRYSNRGRLEELYSFRKYLTYTPQIAPVLISVDLHTSFSVLRLRDIFSRPMYCSPIPKLFHSLIRL
jgi:hypothetical protein